MDFLHFYVNPLLPVARIDIVARNFCPQNFLHRIKESTLLELGEITNHRHSYPLSKDHPPNFLRPNKDLSFSNYLEIDN